MAYGPAAKGFIEWMVALTQFSFCISQMTFVFETVKPIFIWISNNYFYVMPLLPVALLILYMALSLERQLEKFKLAYAAGTYIIFTVCAIVGGFCV